MTLFYNIYSSCFNRPSNPRAVNLIRNPRMPSLQPYVGSSTHQVVNRENPNPEKVNYSYESSQLQMIPEDGTLESMETNGCPQTNSIKTTSPNSKRVSPPYREFGSLTARRSGRKLILKSIPAFPQLSNHDESQDMS